MFILLLVIFCSTSCNSKIKKIEDDRYQELIKKIEISNVNVREETCVWKEMHMMANSKIVADEIWGEIEITKERVDYLITEVLASNYRDKKRLLTILYNWKNEDYSNGVDEHNYLWKKLKGNVGKAYKLRDECNP